MRRTLFAVCLLSFVSLGLISCTPGNSTGAIVQAVAAKGAASPGNNSNADVLVLVTNPNSGAGVTTLTQSDFTVVDQFGFAPQNCGFSNKITGFNNVGTGAYQLSVATTSTTPPDGGCQWVAGDYLGQVIVASASANGQAAFHLLIQ